MTYAHSRQPKEIGQSTSSAAVSHARTSASQARVLGSPVQGPVFGTRCTGSLARYDRDSCSWKTSQRCLDGGWEPYSVTFPRSGTTQNGTLFLLQPLVRRTAGKGSGLWPTPRAREIPNSAAHIAERTQPGRKGPSSLSSAVMWPTPVASTAKRSEGAILAMRRLVDSGAISEQEASQMLEGSLRPKRMKAWGTPTAVCWKGSGKPGTKSHQHDVKNGNLRGQVITSPNGGQLNPKWVEWLMGFPLGWTDLEDSETQSSPKSSS